MRGRLEIRHKWALMGIVVLLLPAAYAVAQVCMTPTEPTFDNRDGHLPPFEEQPVRPMALSSTGDELWVINIPDARVSVFDATNPTAVGGPTLLDEIGVGLGPVTIVPRPGSSPAEMWVVCTSSNSVFVIDEASRQVTTTVRVPFEPNDLTFDETGETAYVTLGAANQIAVIDATAAAGPAITNSIEFESFLPTVSTNRLHAEEPLTLMLEGNDLFAVSHMSGNGTTSNFNACGNPAVPCFAGSGVPFIAQLWNDFNLNPLLPEPPDRDIFRFDVTNPSGAGTVVGWRFGTMNFDLQRRPDTQELLVSNVDLRNDGIFTEQLYMLDTTFFQTKPVVHRLSWGPDAPSAVSNQNVQHFDLNDAMNVDTALVTLNYACAFPNQMAFNASGDRLYVGCYGTNNVAVLEWDSSPRVIAELRSNATVTDMTGFGTHGVLIDEGRDVVYTYEQGDGRLQVYDADPPGGTVNAPLRTVSLGFDITPANIEAGRFHFNNVKNSGLRTESCASCHYRGHMDAIAWDLSDISGDLPAQLGQPIDPNRLFFRDNKNLKVTMTLRGIEETPPFHWRGDREDLQAFGDAQVGLLGGSLLSETALQQIDDFIFNLKYPPNPDQPFERDYSAAALTGLSCFTHDATLNFLSDTTGAVLNVPCVSCHSLAGAAGTNNQVVSDNGGVLIPLDVTQLRGLFDKESDQLVDTLGMTGATTPVSGWGFANLSNFDTVAEFTDVAAGALSPQVQDFFREFDSGMAPTTAYAWTMDQQSAALPIPQDAVTLFASADAGHNDIMVRGLLDLGGGFQPIGMLYEPNGVPLGGLFRSDIDGFGPFTGAQLINAAQLGIGIWHFVGTPVGMGYRLGIDREMDFRLDGDEQATCPPLAANCSSFRTADTDGDLFPDGYEVTQFTDPNDPAVFPANDNAAPMITNERVDWFNSSVAKVRWDTADEESVSRVRVFSSGNQLVAMTEELQYKRQHSLVVRGLTPGQTYSVEVESEDPANLNLPFVLPNTTQSTIMAPLVLQPRLFQNIMHVEETDFRVRGASIPGGNLLIRVTFTIHDGVTAAPLANAPLTVDFDWFEWIPGGLPSISPNSVSFSGTTDAQGRISSSFTTSVVLIGTPGIVEVINTNVVDNVGNRLLLQPESGLHGFGVKKNVP